MPSLWYGRPPPRRRSDRLWWTVVLLAGVLVIAALAYRSFSSAGTSDGSSVSAPPTAESTATPQSVVLSDGCAPGDACDNATTECQGSDCSGPGAPPQATPTAVPAPQVSARSVVVMEPSCSALLYTKEPHQRVAPASLTKIVTALVADDHALFDELVDIDVNGALMKASNGSSVMGLQPGQRLSMQDLLYGLLLPSGNDAALAIGQHVGGTVPAFVQMMNLKVTELGLHNTHFTNPHGLDEQGLYTSAFDIAVLGRKLLSRPELAAIVSTKTYQPGWEAPPVWNGNQLLYQYPGAIGVKTGYTAAAGQSIVAAAERDGRTVLLSLLGSWDRYADATALFDWAFANTTPACSEPRPPSRLSESLP
ncbi:MAG: D-alanyl-D-alanine carboxypeptidase family protein [Dehalococcoidia bacterium]